MFVEGGSLERRGADLLDRCTSWGELELGGGANGLIAPNPGKSGGPCVFGDVQRRRLIGCEVPLGAGPDTGPVDPGVGRSVVRYSPRLASVEPCTILEKAVARRARREDCGGYGGGERSAPSRVKVLSLGTNCGVVLNEGELNSYLEFAAAKV